MKRPVFFIWVMVLIMLLNLGWAHPAWAKGNVGFSPVGNRAQAVPTTTRFVAKQSPLVASVLVPPQKLLQAWVGLIRGENAKLPMQLGGTAISFAKDIQPWIGDESTFAITTNDVDRDPSNGLQPGYLVALTTDNPEKSQAFLRGFWQKRALPSQPIQVETYQGVQLTYQQEDTDPIVALDARPADTTVQSMATATVGNRYLLIANHPKVLRDAINNVQAPNLSLASTAAYQDAVKVLSDQQWGWIFINLPALGQWSARESAQPPAQPLDLFPDYRFDKVAIALRSNRQDLVADVLAIAAPAQTVEDFQPTLMRDLPVQRLLPANSLLSVAGTNLKTLWPALQQGLQGYPDLLHVLEHPQQIFASQANLALFDQVLAWVEGQYGLTLVPGTDPTQPDWVFVAEPSPQFETTLSQLNEQAKRQGYTQVEVPDPEHTITTWTQLQSQEQASSAAPKTVQAKVAAAYTTVEGYHVLATSVAALKTVLAAKTNTALADAPWFERAIAPLERPNAGYAYLNWSASTPVLEQVFPILKWVHWSTPSLFEQLKTISVGASTSPTGMRRQQIVFQLR